MKRILASLCCLMIATVASHAVVTNLTAQADVDIRSFPTNTTGNTGYNRNILKVARPNADPTVAEDSKAYIRFQLPANFGTANSATFTMTRAIAANNNAVYMVFGLNQGPIPGSIWDELTWPELDGGTTNTATTWNNAPGNVVTNATNFSSASFLGSFTVKSTGTGGTNGDSYSISTTNLVAFINKDTNFFITIMMSHSGVTSATDQFASKENTTYSGPQLLLDYNLSTNFPASIAAQPQPTNQTVYATLNATISATVAGTPPITYNWRLNGTNLTDGPNVSGSGTNVLTLSNLTAAMAGNYSLYVSNRFGADTSSNSVLVVSPAAIAFNTAQLSNVWSLAPGSRAYLTTQNTERSIAYNPLTTNLLVASSVSNTVKGLIAVLDATTGNEKYLMDMTGAFPGIGSSSLAINQVQVGDDGALYACSQSINASNYPFYIYVWPDDSSNSQPTRVFAGDPGVSTTPGLIWGDNMAVRGAGSTAQILLAPASGTNVLLLQTSSGASFQNEVPPTFLAISGLPTNNSSGFARRGIAFGPGTNTFWAKNLNNVLMLVQFDLNSQTGMVLNTYSTSQVPGSLIGISVDGTQSYLAGVSLDTFGENVQFYSISDLVGGPVLREQSFFDTQNANILNAGWASTAFGGNYVYALNANNGIKALAINPSWVPVSPFSISSFSATSGNFQIGWPSSVGHNYLVQSRGALDSGSWTNASIVVKGNGSLLNATNTIQQPAGFYRVQGL